MYVWPQRSLWKNISSFLEIGVGDLQGLGTGLMCRSLLLSGRFFQDIFQSWVLMRSLVGFSYSSAGCHFATSLAAKLASLLPGMPQSL